MSIVTNPLFPNSNVAKSKFWTLFTLWGVKKSPNVPQPHKYSWLSTDKEAENAPALILLILMKVSSSRSSGTFEPLILLWPVPSCPLELDPIVYISPLLVKTTVCSSPQATSYIFSGIFEIKKGVSSSVKDIFPSYPWSPLPHMNSLPISKAKKSIISIIPSTNPEWKAPALNYLMKGR